MERANVDGVELEYETRGTGEPVLLIYGSLVCGSFVPLLAQPLLTDDHTESCHVFVSNRVGDVRPDCTGTVVDGYEARVVGEDGRDLVADCAVIGIHDAVNLVRLREQADRVPAGS